MFFDELLPERPDQFIDRRLSGIGTTTGAFGQIFRDEATVRLKGFRGIELPRKIEVFVIDTDLPTVASFVGKIRGTEFFFSASVRLLRKRGTCTTLFGVLSVALPSLEGPQRVAFKRLKLAPRLGLEGKKDLCCRVYHVVEIVRKLLQQLHFWCSNGVGSCKRDGNNTC